MLCRVKPQGPENLWSLPIIEQKENFMINLNMHRSWGVGFRGTRVLTSTCRHIRTGLLLSWNDIHRYIRYPPNMLGNFSGCFTRTTCFLENFRIL
jgi:hypothetical protein